MMTETQTKPGSGTPQVLTTREASEALRISRWKLYDLIRRGALDTIRIGRRRLITADALEKLVSKLEKEAH
jgi:excisionase family DNA binding protein